jgi:hypothetical protein
MYVDDAVIFVKADRNDINNLALILNKFSEVTGLKTNLLITSVTPIHCGDIDLEDTLSGLPVVHTNFPIKYVGLPLMMKRL